MDFAIPESLRSILSAIRELMDRARRAARAQAAEAARSPSWCRHWSAVRDEVKARGLWAPQLPRSLGGMGLSLLEFALVGEELGRSPLGHYAFNSQAPDAGNMELLREFGTEVPEGTMADAPGPGRDPQLLRDDRAGSSRLQPGLDGDDGAVRDGDGYVIDGRKWFASGADGAGFAIVMAVTDPDADPHRRASLLSSRPRRRASAACATSRAWGTRATTGPATPSWRSNRAGSRSRTGWARKGPGSPWRRPGSGRAGSTTRCDGSGSAGARST